MHPELKYLKKQFIKSIERIFGIEWYNHSYLIAVSGGKDSMALATLAHSIGMRFSVAHCDFSLRPESPVEATFVQEYFGALDIPVFTTKFDTNQFARENKYSIQEAARTLRYDYFHSICAQENIDFILTAHHAGDQAETFFINLARGSSPAGLSGIPEQNGIIYRPLLNWPAEDLLRWNRLMPVPWMEDSSNAKTNYARNEVRHHVLPILNERFAGFSHNVLKSMEIQQEYYRYIQSKIHESLHRIKKQYINGDYYDLSLENDYALWPFIVRETLAPLHFSHEAINILLKAILQNKSGIHIESGSLNVYSDRSAFVVHHRPLGSQNISFVLVECDVPLWSGHLQIKKIGNYQKSTPAELILPASYSGNTLTIRNWLPGDRFRVDNKTGNHQKIQNLYTNNKLNHLEKELQPLIILRKEIIWIPCLRNAYFATATEANETEYYSIKWVSTK
jgi:tRNA(Ile)-lysidine synthase